MKRTRAAVVLCLILGTMATAGAGQLPEVSKLIPADAVLAAFVERPGQQIAKAGALLDRFKSLHPDLDMARLGAKIKAEVGENLLTPEGLRAFGVDPEGSLALFLMGFSGDPILVLTLADEKVFVDKLTALYSKGGEKAAPKASRRAGAKVFAFGPDEFAIKGKWCLIVPPPAQRASKGDPVKAFFGQGRKLSSQKSFTMTLSGLPAGQPARFYLSLAAVAREFSATQERRSEAWQKRLNKADPQSRPWLKTELAGMKKVNQRFLGFLANYEGLAAGMQVGEDGVNDALFVSARPKGLAALAKVFPGTSAQPGFHAGLLESSVMGGWASFSLPGFLEFIGDLPASSSRLMSEEMASGAEGFKELFKMDLLQDVLGNLKNPIAAYFLVPDLSGLAADDPADMQFLQLVRFLAVSRVADPSKAEQFLQRLDERAKQDEQKIEIVQVDGVQVRIMRPQPKLEVAWGLRGDALLLGIGKNVVPSSIRLVAPGSWSSGPSVNDQGSARLDFAAVGEVMSSAVSKSIGGRQGMQFRMTWPLIQQVLAKFTTLSSSGILTRGGVLVQGRLGIR